MAHDPGMDDRGRSIPAPPRLPATTAPGGPPASDDRPGRAGVIGIALLGGQA
jgi:hypothetical protein